jgi:signal transduction histidine kinase
MKIPDRAGPHIAGDTSSKGMAADPVTERRAAALKALPTAVRTMTALVDPEELLRTICAVAISLLDASTGSLLIWDPDSDRLYFRVTGADVRDQLEGVSMPSNAGIAGWVFTHRQPALVPDVRKDERFYSTIDESLGHRTTSLIAVPLMTQQQMLGVIEVLDKRSEEGFDELDLDILTALASQAAVAIDNMRMSNKLQQQRQQLITIEQEIHKKLARDQHHGPAQWLAGISMNLEYIVRLMDADPPMARVELDMVRRKLDRTIDQVRNLMFELRPVFLESHDLKRALQHYVDSLNQVDDMNIHLHIDDLNAAFDQSTERAIFDIVREAISNIKRHAHTSDAWVDFSMRHTGRGEELAVTIKDNGLGFDLGAVQQDYAARGSLGMLNMVERAALLGGNLTIDSAPGDGTTIKMTVPIPPKGAQT